MEGKWEKNSSLRECLNTKKLGDSTNNSALRTNGRLMGTRNRQGYKVSCRHNIRVLQRPCYRGVWNESHREQKLEKDFKEEKYDCSCILKWDRKISESTLIFKENEMRNQHYERANNLFSR